MGDSIYVNLHTHTSYSDGALPPEILAERLAAAGVRYAALCDHDTLEGWPAFRDALDARGVPSLPGIELTTQHEGRIVHLVAYGFDPEHEELAATLASMRAHRLLDTHSIQGSLRAAGSGKDESRPGSAAPDGQLAIGDAIRLLHRAGGRVFLAHPLVYDRDPAGLEQFVLELRALGLDGIEAVYEEFEPDEREALRTMAGKHDLLVCAGTDYHAVKGLGSEALGIDMPRDDWVRFRAAVLDGPGLDEQVVTTRSRPAAPAPSGSSANPGALSRRPFVVRVVFPAVAAMALFLVALWGLILPSFEQTLVERKREMIRELTNAAWSVLAAYEADERSGALTREQAQAAAAEVVAELRYGEDRLDYFWIQDTQPTMVMHPYRTDLDGQDLSSFKDPRDVPIFVEFAELVEAQDEGYVDYVWQWFGDPERLEPKESYVKGFEPWGWVIGTGMYVDDVQAEIERIERDLLLAALGISGLIALLLLVVLQQSLRIERRREEGVERLRDSNARYHALVEATSEGTLLIVDGRLRYANPTFLDLLGYSARQLEFLEPVDVMPREGNEALWAALESGDASATVLGVAREGVLTRSDGSPVECVLTLEPVEFGGGAGHILLARDVTAATTTAAGEPSALGSSAGVFRAVAARRGVFVDLSPAARELLALVPVEEGEQLALADCFAHPDEYARVFRRLLDAGEVRDQFLAIDTPSGPRSVLLSGVLIRDEQDEPAWIDGLLVDVTAARSGAADREVQQLRASLLFLHEPVEALGVTPIVVPMDERLGDVAATMTERGATAALVASTTGAPIGIVTDRDIRARVVAVGKAVEDPVETVMTAPLIRLPVGAPVYEALLRMEQAGVRHMAVEDASGGISAVVDKESLIRSPRYAPLVVLRDIARAATVEEVARRCERTVPLAAGLLASTSRPRPVNSTLTSVYDAATVRLLELALEDLGPAPAPFAWMAFGSQGRGEVHLTSDQDTGLVYGVPEGADEEELGAWFRRLGERVSAGLAAAGYPLCRGRVMASEPKWCRSLAGWIETYDGWLRRMDGQDVADISVFLDFRLVRGDAALVGELRRHVHDTLPDQRGVQYLLARNALAFRPPLRLPGNIYLGGAAESSGRFDLKDALQPMVAFARVYAERQRIVATHTMERIGALADRDLLAAGSRDEIADAYDFLMGLRLATQLGDIRAGREPSSVVELSSLTSIQRELLRGSFAAIADVQKTAEREFPEVA
jgi:PAS domain S-box-containing protein